MWKGMVATLLTLVILILAPDPAFSCRQSLSSARDFRP
jgi:hypothetical protein